MKDLKRHDDRHEPGPIESGFMVLSAVVVVALFGFTIFQAVTAPEVATLHVDVVKMTTTPDGVEVVVQLRNDGSTGWRAVTVSVDCDDPPPQLTFEQIPPGSVRTAMLACPAGTQDPQASVASRLPA